METVYDDAAPVVIKDPALKTNEERLEGSEFKQTPRKQPRQSSEVLEEAERKVYDGIHSEVETPASNPHLEALAAKFRQDSPWYFTDPAMRAYADMISASYRAINQSATPEQILEYVGKEVPKQFKGRTQPDDDNDDEDGD